MLCPRSSCTRNRVLAQDAKSSLLNLSRTYQTVTCILQKRSSKSTSSKFAALTLYDAELTVLGYWRQQKKCNTIKNSCIHARSAWRTTKKFETPILQDIKCLRAALENCRKPTVEPGPDTYNELFALRRFADRECQHAPWLFNIVQTTIRDDFHFAAIPGGFLIFALMLDLPRVRLTTEYLESLDPDLRSKIRKSFNTALKSVSYPYLLYVLY